MGEEKRTFGDGYVEPGVKIVGGHDKPKGGEDVKIVSVRKSPDEIVTLDKHTEQEKK
jgi:hypothetical protein